MFDYSRTPPYSKLGLSGGSPARMGDTNTSAPFSPLDQSFPGSPGRYGSASSGAGGPGGAGEKNFWANQRQTTAPSLSGSFHQDTTTQIQLEVEQQAIVSQLRVENRNLRMRLLYLDELISKRGLNPEIVNDVVDLKMEVDVCKKKIAEHQEELAIATARHVAACAELDRLRPVEAQAADASERAALVPELQDLLRRARLQCDISAAELAEARRQLDEEQHTNAVKLQRLHDDNGRVSQQLRNVSIDLQERWAAERSDLTRREATSVAESDVVKAELQAMVQQKAAALAACEREVDSSNAKCSELLSEASRLRRTVADGEAEAATARVEADGFRLKLRDANEASRAELMDRDKKIAALQLRMTELEHAVTAGEDTVSVYKAHFHRLADEWKHSAAAAAAGSDTLRLSSASIITASTTAAEMTSSVLNLVVEECISLHRQDAAKTTASAVETLSRLFSSHSIAFEDSQNIALSRLRRLQAKIGDVADLSKMIKQRRMRAVAHDSSRYSKIREECDQLSEQLRGAQRTVHALTVENQALREDAHRLAHDRTADMAAQQVAVALEQTRDTVLDALHNVVLDMRHASVDTNTLTVDFLDSVKQTVAKAHRLTEAVHDTVSMARAAGSSPFPSGQAELHAAGTISARTLTLEQLIKNTANICVLLETNLIQAREAEQRQKVMLNDWEGRIASQLSRSLDSFSTPTGKPGISLGGGASSAGSWQFPASGMPGTVFSMHPQQGSTGGGSRSVSRQAAATPLVFDPPGVSSMGPQYVMRRTSPDLAMTPAQSSHQGGASQFQAVYDRTQFLHVAAGAGRNNRTAAF